jgi:hypothetical protein
VIKAVLVYTVVLLTVVLYGVMIGTLWLAPSLADEPTTVKIGATGLFVIPLFMAALIVVLYEALVKVSKQLLAHHQKENDDAR